MSFESLRKINNRVVQSHFKETEQPIIKRTSIAFDGIYYIDSTELEISAKKQRYSGISLNVLKNTFDSLDIKRGDLITIRSQDHKFISNELLEDGTYILILQKT